MKRSLLVLVAGLVVGLVTHVAYFRLHQPVAIDSLDTQLAWMRTELNLTEAQYARIRELHVASTPRLRLLAAQVSQLQSEFAAFEELRRTSDRVDFLEFARAVESRRLVNRECEASTRQLVQASAEVMNPDQRQRYISLLATAEPMARTLLN